MPPAGAEITVTGKGELIVDGDSTPSLLDDTDFGVVGLGSSVEHTFTVKNLGTSTLYLAMNSLTGGPGWVITKYPMSALSPGLTDMFKVTFAPTSTGQSSTVVTITNNDADENPYNFTLLGSTNAPEIGVSGNGNIILDGDTSPSLSDWTDFGSILPGQFVDRTFTVKNSGSATLTLNPPQLPAGFSIVESLVSQLAANASDTFTVRFSPSASGSYPGEISIGNNDSDENPFNFAIRGASGAPEIEVRGSNQLIVDGDWTPSLTDGTDFGSITTGQTVSRTFTVKNTGAATLTLQTPQLPNGFLLMEGLVSSLASQASDTFTVRFSPSSTGTFGGDIVIDNNDSDESTYNFAIKGVMNGPEITVFGNGFEIVDGDLDPSSTDGTWFGTVGSGQTVDRTFQVNNTGTAVLSLFLYPLPTGFTLVESLASALAAGGTDTFTVRFAPTTVNSYGGWIKIDNNDADENPYNFAIFGMMGTPEIDVRGKGISIVDGDNTPSALDDTYFGMTPPNIVATRTFTVLNQGTSVLELGQPSLGSGSGFRLGNDTLLSSLQPGQSDTFSIELLSATPGTYNRTLTIWNNDTGGTDGLNESPYNFAIRGIVGAPEIDVTGKGLTIIDGDTSPSLSDDTDFGTVLISSPTTTNVITKTFTVKNTGTGTLYLGIPSVTGPGFWRGAKVLATYLEPNQSDTFDVKFSSTTAGNFTGEVILYNSDANESPYNFFVKARIGQAPTNVTLSPSSIAENNVSPARVGDLTVTDPDVGDTHTFTLDSSFGDGSLFSISGRTLFAAPLDFEDPHGPTYSIRVTATDSFGLSITKTLTVTVTNVNEAPTDITLSPSTIVENFGNPSHIYVGDLTAVDPDAMDAHTFSLDNTFGDGSSFSVGGNTLYANNKFDFEDAHGPTYSVRVTAMDAGGLSFTKTLTITVTDVNEPPVIDPNQEFSVDENSAAGTVVGSVTFADPDTADTHTFTIVSGNTGGTFVINNAGTITVQNAALLDFGQNQTFTLSVKVTDSGTPALSDTKTISILINNVPEHPVIIDLDTRTSAFDDPNVTVVVDAWMQVGNSVTTMRAKDDDPGEEATLTWHIVYGNFDNLFAIQGSGPTSKIVLVSDPSNAARTSYPLIVEVKDATGLIDTGYVTVEISLVTVGFTVDSQAVESSTLDVIEITLHRFEVAENYSNALTVYIDHNLPAVEPVSGGLAISDFNGSSAGLSLLNTKQITIPANSQTLTVTLTALGDTLIENIEHGRIWITAPPSGANSYAVIAHSTEAPGEDYLQIVASAELEVLDAWTLFVDGKPGSPETGPRTGSAHYNDLRQGEIGDCFCLAAVAELAVTHNSVIYNAIQPVSGTTDTFTVTYYDENGTQHTTTVVVNLDRGKNGAGLSGDYDSTGVEVWTWVIERAFAQTHGGYCNINDGGLTDHAWKWLTGKDAVRTELSNTVTDQQIWDQIASNFGNGHQKGVMVGTPPTGAPDIAGVDGRHALAVVAVVTTAGAPDFVTLYIPWGAEVNVPFDRLSENIARVVVGEY